MRSQSQQAGVLPVLLLLKGPPGSGKSTLAEELARVMQWSLVDKDDARSSFQPLAAAHPGVDWNELSYAVMWRVVGTQLKCGLSVVVDCPLARRSLFDQAAALATEHGARLALVELEPRDADEWRRRVERRGEAYRGTTHEHKPGSWADIQAGAARNAGSEAWTAALAAGEVAMRCRVEACSAGRGSVAEQVDAVLRMLHAGSTAVPGACPDILSAALGGDQAAGAAATGAAADERQAQHRQL